jgi:histidyl-tRNA synthetase
MQLKKKPVTGMKDILPKEMEIRNYVLGVMKETYRRFGFVSMETPCVEHLENLNSKQGGENEKLIFKILKRGEKLKMDEAKEENDLVDCGLRYDLTVPLCRYYANHSAELPSPFKALQTGNVWRADRPQRGRYRQFMQCDIDVIGEASCIAEIDLILATSAFLGEIDFKKFTIRINDRRILKAMAAYSGFAPESFDTVFIILDKMDKIGIEGVAAELEKEGFDRANIATYLNLFQNIEPTVEGIRYLKKELEGCLEPEVADNLENIIYQVEKAKQADFGLVFDPTLVRGMSYYTGPIFEITMDEFGGSVGGGGRYDEMIGKFTGQSTPACGFSIGFERIVMLLLEHDFSVPRIYGKRAYLVDKNITKEALESLMSKVMIERSKGMEISVDTMKKNKKFQKEQLAAEGYSEIVEIFAD